MKLSQFLAAWAGAIVGITVYDHYLGPKLRDWLARRFPDDLA